MFQCIYSITLTVLCIKNIFDVTVLFQFKHNICFFFNIIHLIPLILMNLTYNLAVCLAFLLHVLLFFATFSVFLLMQFSAI